MRRPVNEQGVVAMFAKHDEDLGFVLMEVQIRFPDATVYEIHSQQLLRVEFEFKASNFKAHGHDIHGCDLIVCWDNDWRESPLPILDLKSRLAEELPDMEKVRSQVAKLKHKAWSALELADEELSDEISETNRLRVALNAKASEIDKVSAERRMLNKMFKRGNMLPRGKAWACKACGGQLGMVRYGNLRIACECGNTQTFCVAKPSNDGRVPVKGGAP
jgi:hypothetical protein